MALAYKYLSIASSAVSIAYFVIVFRQSPSKEQKTLQLITVCNLLYCIFDTICAVSTDSSVCEAGLYMSYIGASNIGLCYILFLAFVIHDDVPTYFKYFCFSGNLFFTIMALTNNYHHLMYSSVNYILNVNGIPIRDLKFGPLFIVYVIWYSGSMVVPIMLVLRCRIKRPMLFRAMRKSIITLFSGGVLGFACFLICSVFNTKFDFTAIVCCIGVSVFLMIIYKMRTYPMQQNFEEAILGSITDYIIAVDSKGGLIYMNPKAIELLNEGDSFVYGLNYRGLSDKLDYLMSKQQNETIDYEDRKYSCEIKEIRDKFILRGYIHWLRDVTKEQNYIIESQRLTKKAEEANEAKSRFLSHMSHEIRTPINAILGMNELISRETKEKLVLDCSDTIGRSVKTLLTLINDILDFTKVEAGKLDIFPSEYKLPITIKDLASAARLRIGSKPLVLNVSVEPTLSRVLYGDEVRVKQVITNILTNAVKYTNEGHVDFSVSYEDMENGNIMLIVDVTDTGIGIKKEDLPRLYDRFERLDNNGNSSTEGTGLGMNITKSLLELMKGELEVESEYGKGSHFRIKIPQKTVGTDCIGKFVETDVQEKHEKKHKTFFEAPSAEILVVDDNTINRVVAVSLLKNNKIHFDQADSGAKCLEMIAKKHYDLILLDYRMPQMSGVEVLEQIKKDNTHMCVGVPVIVMTADAGEESRFFFFEKGFNDYLVKPMNPEIYERMVYEYLPKDKVTII